MISAIAAIINKIPEKIFNIIVASIAFVFMIVLDVFFMMMMSLEGPIDYRDVIYKVCVFFIYLLKIIFWIYSLAISMSSCVSLLYGCYSRVWFEYKPSINLIINETIYFTVFLQFFTPNFNWRIRSRTIALIFNVSRFLYVEFIHCLSIYALYKGFRKPNSEWQDIFRASSEIIAIIISLFNSIQCSLVHAHFIYCIFKGVSKLTINSCNMHKCGNRSNLKACLNIWLQYGRILNASKCFSFLRTNFTNISLQHFDLFDNSCLFSETYQSHLVLYLLLLCFFHISFIFNSFFNDLHDWSNNCVILW